MSDLTNVDIVRRTYEAVGRGDVLAVLALVSEDVEWTLQGPASIPFAGVRYGHDGVAEYFALIGEHLEFEEFGPREIIGQDALVVALGYERGRAKATGRAVAQEWVHVYTLRDGKITTFRAFEDTAALATAFRSD